MTKKTTIPAGYRQDAKGRLWPESQIKPIDLTRDQLVTDIVAAAKVLSGSIGEFKSSKFADIAAFLQLSAEQHGVKLGGAKGNLSLVSFDGRFKVQRAIAENITFDEQLQAAKVLIDECLADWTRGARGEVRLLVQDAFRADSAGNIRTAEVLRLRRIEITDERWQRAMTAISDAIQVIGSKSYLRVYERDEDTGEYRAIPLDVAGA